MCEMIRAQRGDGVRGIFFLKKKMHRKKCLHVFLGNTLWDLDRELELKIVTLHDKEVAFFQLIAD